MVSAVIIATSYGVERDEIVVPRDQLTSIGVSVTVATPSNHAIETLVGDRETGPIVDSDVLLSEIRADDYDLLVIPGGTINADSLRLEDDAKRIAADFAKAGKPIAAICHGPWLIAETDFAVGKSLTSYPSLRTDINNAGGIWVDEPVVVDETNGFVLITSRTPDDLGQFTTAIERQVA
ncbi:DJ-1/PfpI/YhbO family deglycase/protease [Brevibacterium sp. 1718]|uniref:DJ-1/PfpI/YhbO family deglycase/protease n=1 Tax=Brevibacterium sp. 1718 TaxID=3413510 RepID=UPI003DA7E0F2